MFPSMDIDSPVFQTFKSKNGKPLKSLPTFNLEKDRERFLLWSDIELAFKGVESLTDKRENRVMFEIDGQTV